MKIFVSGKLKTVNCFKLLTFVALALSIVSQTAALRAAGPDASPLAVISRAQGKVIIMIRGSEKWTKAKTGDFLFEGDRVKTGKKARAVINFISGIDIDVNEETEFTIKLSERQGGKREEMDMILGEILSKVRPGGDYRVRTPQAVTAVRGTKFGVRAKKGFTEVYVLEGAVDVSNSYGKIICNPGEKTTIGAGEPPAAPEKMKEDTLSDESSWTGKETELTLELELKSEKGFIAGLPVEVSLRTGAAYNGKIEVKTSAEDFKVSKDGEKWLGAGRFKMQGGVLTFYCMKKNSGAGVMTIDNDDIKTLITAVNFDEAKEKKLNLKLDDGRELNLKFEK
ncbi:FecR family protein [bacterium]|nr:FecR domain-containing protein [bacterium]MBU3954997.1 FecR family protein [bacterium]MBU4134148.1 FecR family protein [bacterium]